MAFCTVCGKKLNDGEVCTCQLQTETNGFSGQGFDFDEETDTSSSGFDNGFDEGFGDNDFEPEESPEKEDTYESHWSDPDYSIWGQIKSVWVAFSVWAGIGDPDMHEIDVYESDMQIVPECIDANEGEVPIKQYDMALLRSRLKFTRAEGRLQVTNKRVIFRAAGRSLVGRTTLQHEFSIEEIAGLEIRKDHRFSLLNLFLCMYLAGICIGVPMALMQEVAGEGGAAQIIAPLIFSIVGLVPFFLLYKKFILKFVGLSCSISGSMMLMQMTENEVVQKLIIVVLVIAVILWLWILFVMFFVPNLELIIKTKGASPAVEIRRKKNHLFAPNKPEYTGFAEVLPWRDTEMAIIEVGAMIEDIQNFGDAALKKWKEEA